MLQAPTTYVSRSSVYLRPRLSFANTICSQATGHHNFVPCYNCRKGNHYFTNLCQNCKLLLTSRSFPSSPRSFPPLCPVLFLRIASAPYPPVTLFSASILLHSIALPTPIGSAFSFPTAFFFEFSFARIRLIATFVAYNTLSYHC